MEHQGASDNEETGTCTRYRFHSLARLYQTMLSQYLDADHTQYIGDMYNIFRPKHMCARDAGSIKATGSMETTIAITSIANGTRLGLYGTNDWRYQSFPGIHQATKRQGSDVNSQNHE
jgi:hypothetical protein